MPLTKREVQAVVKRAREGATSTELAREFNLTRRSICYIRKEYNVSAPRGMTRLLNPKKQARILGELRQGKKYRELAAGYTAVKIAERYNISESLVAQVSRGAYEMPSVAAKYRKGNEDLRIKFRGKTMNLAEWSRELDINRSVLYQRLQKGESVRKAFTTPVTEARHGKYIKYKGEERNISEWSRKLGVGPDTIAKRMAEGLPLNEVFKKTMRKSARRSFP